MLILKKIFKDRRFRVILLLFLLIFILLGLKLLMSNISPILVKSTPTNQQNNVPLGEKIILTFDQRVNESDWQVFSSPSFEFKLKADKENLEIQPQKPLEAQTNYRLEIKNRRFPDFLSTLSFTTTFLPVPLPAAKGDSDFWQKEEKEILKNYPLIYEIPHQAENWVIYYQGPFHFLVKLKKDNATIRREVLDWIQSQGIDPKTHQITWQLVK